MRRSIINPSLNRRTVGSNIVSFILTLVLLVFCVYTFCKILPNLVTSNTLMLGVFFAVNVLTSFRTILALPNVTNVILALNVTISTGILVCRHAGRRLHTNGSLGGTVTSNCDGTFSTVFSSGLASVVANIMLFCFNANPVHNFTAAVVVNLFTSFLATIFLAHVICRTLLTGSGLGGIAFAASVAGSLLAGPGVGFLTTHGIKCLVPTNVVILNTVSVSAVNLGGNVSFANKHGCIVHFTRSIGASRIHGLLSTRLSNSIDIVRVNAPSRIHMSAGCGVRSGSPTVSRRVRGGLFRNIGSLLPRKAALTRFASRCVRDSRGMKPDVTSSVGGTTFLTIMFTVFYVTTCVLLHFHSVSFSINTFTSMTIAALYVVSFCALL